jgi:signal transduction histidine kinase
MAVAASLPSERDLLTRLVAGTAGVLGKEFLKRLVAELAAALNAEVAFVAELCEDDPTQACTIASAGPLREGYRFALAGTPCEDAYRTDLLLVSRGARLRYPADAFLRAHALDGYLAIALHDSRSRPIGHIGVIASGVLDPSPSELQALRVFGARAGAELERRRHEQALAASRARAIEAADEERRRIGRDLHDGAQQRLVVLGQALDLALRELEADPHKAVARLSAAREQAAVASRELRELAQGLHPVGLERGLRKALVALAIQSPLELTIEELPDVRLPAVVEATVWFVVSEALTNAIKHARATELRVSAWVDDALFVTVADNGVGGASEERGTGLYGLRTRVESLGGVLRVDSLDGTTLTATIPIQLGPT